MALRAHRHLPSGVFALARDFGGISGVQQDRRALFTGTAMAIGAWVVFLAVLWWGISPR